MVVSSTIDIFKGNATIAAGDETWNLNLGELLADRVIPAIQKADQLIAKYLGHRRVSDYIRTDGNALTYVADYELDPDACQKCVIGCDCEIGTPGCGHHCCWGQDSDSAH